MLAWGTESHNSQYIAATIALEHFVWHSFFLNCQKYWKIEGKPREIFPAANSGLATTFGTRMEGGEGPGGGGGTLDR